MSCRVASILEIIKTYIGRLGYTWWVSIRGILELIVRYSPGAAFLVCTIVWLDADDLNLDEAGCVANMGFEMEIDLVEHLLAKAENAE